MNTLKLALEGVEKERDFYFSKLREVELLCQEQGEENAPFVGRLMEVLYAADEQVGPGGAARLILVAFCIDGNMLEGDRGPC